MPVDRTLNQWNSTLPSPDLVPQYRGDWAAVTYQKADVVNYGGNTYIALVDTTAAQVPGSNPAIWKLILSGTANAEEFDRIRIAADNTSNAVNTLTLSQLATRSQSSGPQFVDGHRWVWQATGPSDGGYIVPGSTGFWKREISSITPVNPEWFGLLATDTLKVQAAIALAATLKRPVYLPRMYTISGLTHLTNHQGVPFIADNLTGGFLAGTSMAGNRLVYIDSGSSTAQVAGFYARGVRFVGRQVENGFSEHAHLLHMNGVVDADISWCSFEAMQGDGVYVGSGINDAPPGNGYTERHNRNVAIRHCAFKGANDNRNGISFIDGDGITIEYNRFDNITRPNMPGPIDCEPDPNQPWAVLRNIVIRGNVGRNCGGNAGMIGLLIPKTQAQLSTPVENILIENNDFEGYLQSDSKYPIGIEVFQGGTITTAHKRQVVVVRNNRMKKVRIGAYYAGIADVRSTANVYEDITGTGLNLGVPDTGTPHNVLGFKSRDDVYRNLTGDSIIDIANGTNIEIIEPVFENCTAPTKVRLLANFTTSRVEVIRPRTIGGSASSQIVGTQGGHTTDATLNRYEAGQATGITALTIGFSYTPPTLQPRSTHAATVDLASSAAYANTFPVGLTFFAFNGGTNGPGGATQGTVMTYIDASFGSDGIGFSWQMFFRRGTAGPAYIRYGGTSVGAAWGSWQRFGYSAQAAPANLAAAPTQTDFNNLLTVLKATGVLT